MSDSWSDRILDSFLEEIISGKNPPDLTEEILSQLNARRTNPNLAEQSQSGFDDLPIPELPDDQAADRSWWKEVTATPAASNNIPTYANSVTGSNTSLRRVELARAAKRKSHRLWLAVGISACVIALINVAIFINQLDESQPQQVSANTTSPNSSAPSTSKANIAIAESPSKPEAEASPAPERLDINGLPFAVIEPDAMPANPEAISSNQDEILLTDEEIIAEIDDTFEELWKDNNVVSTAAISDAEWLSRTGAVLLDVEPTKSQIDLFSQADDPNKRSYLLQQATSSERFARVLASQLADAISPRKIPNAQQWQANFENWLTQNIAQRTPYNEITYRLLTAKKPKSKQAPVISGNPEQYWLVSQSDVHGNLATERVGNLWLNQSLQCSRCHDQGEAIEQKQSSYWAMVAAFNVNDLPEIFYERSDGTLSSAVAALPNGKSLEQLPPDARRQEFANFIKNSPELAEGTVNLVWKFILGVPLVSGDVAARNDKTAEEQKALLKTLAQQFRVHRYDLPRLVMWIASSKPFAVPSRAVSQRDWMIASEQDLRNIRLSEKLFASFRRLELREVNPRQLLGQVLQAERTDAKNSMRRTVLAQPLPAAKENSNVVATLSDKPLAAWEQDLRLHASLDSDSFHQEQIRRLLATKLSWPQLVHHALGYQPSQEELKLADELLQFENGNKEAALLKIHWTSHHNSTF